MRFQSKKREYSIIVKKSFYRRFEEGGRELVPGLKARFVGPQRIFDSEQAQKLHGWSDEDRVYVENWLLKRPEFNNGIYLAPGETLTEDQINIASSLPSAFKAKCTFIELVEGGFEQCLNQATAGREFCADHDPKQPKISRGLLTTDS